MKLLTFAASAGISACAAFGSSSAAISAAAVPENAIDGSNPLVKTRFTADPAGYSDGEWFYVFMGHDDDRAKGYLMFDWSVVRTKDMVEWEDLGTVMSLRETFPWARPDKAWASQAVKRNGKWYWYICTSRRGGRGDAIAVAVADDVKGPWKDPLGKPLAEGGGFIDPSVMIDDDGKAYLFWGNHGGDPGMWYVELKENMIEFAGEIKPVPGLLDAEAFGEPLKWPRRCGPHRAGSPQTNFVEAPWIYKFGDTYYLEYASGGLPEKWSYSTAKSIHGPWKFGGKIMDNAGGTHTIHGGSVFHKGEWYMLYHDGNKPGGGDKRRSVRIERYKRNADGSIPFIKPTADGVKPKEPMSYVMVYHKDADHSLHMAVSDDSYNWRAVNGDKPVVKGEDIAVQKGIRDPHIARTPDGVYVVAATDLHIFARQHGYRTTEWERDGKKYAWGNNRGLVLLTSRDLVNWEKRNLDFSALKCPTQAKDAEGNDIPWSEVGCTWAPELVWDDDAGSFFMHFTTRFGNGKNQIYAVHLKKDLTGLAEDPFPLYSAPRDENGQPRYNIIDSDMVRDDEGLWHLFYVSHEHGASIRHATGRSIRGPFEDAPYFDGERRGHEAPSCWRRPDGTWVVMWDRYTMRPHNFGFVETKDFKEWKPIGYFNDRGSPMKREGFSEQKHGAIVEAPAGLAHAMERHFANKLAKETVVQ